MSDIAPDATETSQHLATIEKQERNVLDATSEKIPSASCRSDIGVKGGDAEDTDSGGRTMNHMVSVAECCCLPPMVGLLR